MISAMNDGHLYQEVVKLLRTLPEYKKYKPLYILIVKRHVMIQLLILPVIIKLSV